MELGLSGRPLLDTAADAALFVNRSDELAALEKAVTAGMNVLVVGARGSGVTSLLRHTAYRLREAHTRPLLVIAGGLVSDVVELLDFVYEGLTGRRRTVVEPSQRQMAMEALSHSVSGRHVPVARREPLVALAVLDDLRHALGDRPATIVLDGVPDATVAYTLFGRLRDELWTLPLTWVVSVALPEQAVVIRPPADAFFEQTLTVEPLSPLASLDLLRRRLPNGALSTSELEGLVALGAGNPRALLAATRARLLEHRSLLDQRQAQEIQRAQLQTLGPAAASLADELAALGAASASDPELLRRLGWKRSRTTQVLRQLETAGLAVGTPEPVPGGGRPRKVYRLTPDLTP